jgi:CheY-like chemotaxis protein
VSETGGIKPRARHILIVDDDPDFTMLFKDFLVSHQPGAWIVHTADHYAPALTAIKQHPIDLVTLDLKMPIMDGMQLLPLIKRTHPGLQVVVLTSAALPENRNFCLQNGAALFLNKEDVATGFDKIYAALEAVASAPSEGFRGMLRQVGLTEVLQMECLGRKSSILEITTAGASGRIFIHDGTILHAEVGEKIGEPALFELLGYRGGEFQLKPYSRPPRQTIDGHWESLMMEAARVSDEALAGGPLDEKGNVIAPAPAPKVETPEREIQEIVLCSMTGELLYEWRTNQVEKQITLLDQMMNSSHAIGEALDWTRGERLEIESAGGRVVMLFQPDRKLLIRSAPPGGASK